MNLTYRLSSWAFAESSPSHRMRLRVLSEHIAATSWSVAWMWWTDWPSLILGVEVGGGVVVEGLEAMAMRPFAASVADVDALPAPHFLWALEGGPG